MSTVRRSLAGFRRDTHGVSAVEFALIAPLLILFLAGSFEITRAVAVKTRVELLARTVGDFVAREQAVDATTLTGIVNASKSVMYPSPITASVLSTEIESIIKKPDDKYYIDWSYYPNQTTPTNKTDRLSTFIPKEDSVIKTKITYTYKLTFAKVLAKLRISDIVMTSTTYMAPRRSPTVDYP